MGYPTSRNILKESKTVERFVGRRSRYPKGVRAYMQTHLINSIIEGENNLRQSEIEVVNEEVSKFINRRTDEDLFNHREVGRLKNEVRR